MVNSNHKDKKDNYHGGVPIIIKTKIILIMVKSDLYGMEGISWH